MSPVNAPQPPQTDPEIFEHGIPVWVVTGPRSQTVEEWVQGLAKTTGLRMDWRMVGGRCVVLVLGDRVACVLAQTTIAESMEALRDQYLACPYNWLQNVEREDVTGRPLDVAAEFERSAAAT